MNGRDAAWRLGGLLALAAAGGTSLVHREVLATRIDGAASSLEFVLGLCSFVLASLGVLLLIQGAKLRDGWIGDCKAPPQAGRAGQVPDTHAKDEQARTSAIAADPYALAGGRAAIASFLAERAIHAAAAAAAKNASPNRHQAGHSS